MSRILVIEDELRLLRNIVQVLTESGYEADGVQTLAEVNAQFDRPVDLVVLDLGLPDGYGLDWLVQYRRRALRGPVIVLTARDAVSDRVAGLDSGADDYLTKPFSFDELLARIRVRLRTEPQATANTLTVEYLSADLVTRIARLNGKVLELQNRQFDFLVFLMRHANQIVDRATIAKEVWKEPTATWTNIIEVHVNRLRKKIEHPDLPPLLHTVRGKGYVLGAPP